MSISVALRIGNHQLRVILPMVGVFLSVFRIVANCASKGTSPKHGDLPEQSQQPIVYALKEACHDAGMSETNL